MLYHDGLLDEALAQLKQARAEWPSGQDTGDRQTQLDLAAILSVSAGIHELEGHDDEAIARFREILAVFPGREAVRERLRRLEQGEAAGDAADFLDHQLAEISSAGGGRHVAEAGKPTSMITTTGTPTTTRRGTRHPSPMPTATITRSRIREQFPSSSSASFGSRGRGNTGGPRANLSCDSLFVSVGGGDIRATHEIEEAMDRELMVGMSDRLHPGDVAAGFSGRGHDPDYAHIPGS